MEDITIVIGICFFLGIFNLVTLFRHARDIKDLKFLLHGAHENIAKLNRKLKENETYGN